ncbi:MAG TPA: hypothetical protein VFN10_02460, partial [Thermoanaerobaculia bacterium]|nr:hypothetical protein [Thermoanaerobaculia bacterium]
MEAFSIEDIVRTSDDAAVRRRFDQRNIGWLTGVLCFFVLVVIAEFVDHGTRGFVLRTLLASANALLVVSMLFVLREVRLRDKKPRINAAARYLQRHVSAAVLTYLTLQYALCLAVAGVKGGWVGWTMCFPFFLLGFRLLVSELLLIHGYLFVFVPVMAFLSALPAKEIVGVHIGALLINGLCLTVELTSSRRMRLHTVGEWTERRAQARDQLRMREELQVARELQLAMLPECAPDV